MAQGARPTARRRGPRRPIHCPRCGEPVVWEGNPWRPFCSERCQLIDRGAWAEEAYRVPSEDSASIESDEE